MLAHAGIGSRRSCEEVITQGRVTVDGQVVRELGSRVDPKAKIAVDGQRIYQERMVYFAVSKPKGYVSTNSDPAGRPRVVDLLPELPQRVYTVGRLDEMSTGLMLLTNDGELANKLSHPKFGVEKLYRCIVAGFPERTVLDQLTKGVWLAEGKVRAKRVRITGRKGEATLLEMVLAEGKNREVRRMLAKLGHKVMSLTRIAVGPITLKGLAPGGYRPLSAEEIDLLHKVAAGISVATPRSSERKTERRPVRTASRPRIAPGTQREGDRPGPAGRRPQGEARPTTPPSQRPAPRRSQDQGRDDRRPPAPVRAPSGALPPRSRAPKPGDAPMTGARLVRPEGPPPSQRRPVAPPPVDRDAPPAGRRIIGLDAGPRPGPARPAGPAPRRPGAPKQRKFPRSGLGPRKPRNQGEGDD